MDPLKSKMIAECECFIFCSKLHVTLLKKYKGTVGSSFFTVFHCLCYDVEFEEHQNQ